MVAESPRIDTLEAHPKIAYVIDWKTGGTGGGTNSNSGWTNRDLTIVNDDGSFNNAGSSLVTLNTGTKEFTITSAGKYKIKWIQVFYGSVAGIATRINCAANSAFTIQGHNGYNTQAASIETCGEATLTLTGATTFTLQYFTGSVVATYGLGVSGSTSNERYSTVIIEKVR